jgi:hypothetical protein
MHHDNTDMGSLCVILDDDELAELGIGELIDDDLGDQPWWQGDVAPARLCRSRRRRY